MLAHTKNKDTYLTHINASSKGLSKEDVAKSKATHGENILQSKAKTTIIMLIIEELKQFLNMLLIIAALVSIIASGHVTDGLFILAIVVLNTALSVFQTRKASNEVEALKNMSNPLAKVYRDNNLIKVDMTEVVVGDVVVLEAGDYVPADVRLVETVNLKVDESNLTGESVAVEKDADAILDEKTSIGDRINMAYASTIVTYGRGLGVVTHVGMKTEVGTIATMLNEVDDLKTPLQDKINRLGKVLGLASIVVVSLIFIIGLLYGMDILELFIVSVSLAVAAIPEGLPTVITVVLALGMRKMANKNAIVKTLSAVETLGSVTVISTDKTGTLTQNKMVVEQLFDGNAFIDVTGDGYDFDGNINTHNDTVDYLTSIAALCNDATIKGDSLIGDPTELALVTLAEKNQINHINYRNTHKRLDEFPFDSDRKRMSTLHAFNDGNRLYTKGAFDGLIKICTHYLDKGVKKPINDAFIQRVRKKNDELARNAMRVLAFAMKPLDDYKNLTEEEHDLTFVGLTGMIDPAREEVKPAIKLCHTAGIRVVMITGDHKLTASAIGTNLGILQEDSEALSGEEIDAMDDKTLIDYVKRTNVYARVSPAHKVRIVKALQSAGEITSMTGDGVNDAPALKQANIGVAMGITGTDVSKEAADIVLMDDNFTTIVDAVKEGRVIFANIRKFVGYLVSCNIGEILVIFIAMVLGWGSPLLAIQILWINLVTDSFPAFALGLEKEEDDVMTKAPNDPDATIIDKFMGITIAFQAGFLALAVLSSFYIGTFILNNQELGQTMAFITIIMGELFRTYSGRSETKSVFTMNPFENKFVNYAFILGIALLAVILFVPGINDLFHTNVSLSLNHLLIAMSLGLVPLFGGEISKLFKKQRQTE
ncbi:MAG: cation-translocating P-type ATPase [Bacillota bacterium]